VRGGSPRGPTPNTPRQGRGKARAKRGLFSTPATQHPGDRARSAALLRDCRATRLPATVPRRAPEPRPRSEEEGAAATRPGAWRGEGAASRPSPGNAGPGRGKARAKRGLSAYVAPAPRPPAARAEGPERRGGFAARMPGAWRGEGVASRPNPGNADPRSREERARSAALLHPSARPRTCLRPGRRAEGGGGRARRAAGRVRRPPGAAVRGASDRGALFSGATSGRRPRRLGRSGSSRRP
jgi:hypothetical protein